MAHLAHLNHTHTNIKAKATTEESTQQGLIAQYSPCTSATAKVEQEEGRSCWIARVIMWLTLVGDRGFFFISFVGPSVAAARALFLIRSVFVGDAAFMVNES